MQLLLLLFLLRFFLSFEFFEGFLDYKKDHFSFMWFELSNSETSVHRPTAMENYGGLQGTETHRARYEAGAWFVHSGLL